MRVTNNMLIANNMWNISNNTKRLEQADQQESTQSKIDLPSDDPEVATNAVKYRSYVASVTQYQQNASDASSWMSVTEGALSDLNTIVQQVRDYTVQASNGTMSTSDLASMNTEVGQLKQAAIDTLNTSYAGRYVFGGYSTDKAPYATTTTSIGTGSTTTTVDQVTFKGQVMDWGSPVSTSISAADYGTAYASATAAGTVYQSGATKQSMQYNLGFGSQIAVNVEGQDVVGTGTGSNLFDTLDELSLGLSGATSYNTIDASGNATTTSFTLSDVLGNLDTDLNRISAVTTDLGARENYVNLATNTLSNDSIVYTKLMSTNEDVDSAAATTNESTAQAVYDASLTVAAKADTKTLLDYLS